jgi:aminoglycoside phosphotransferase (APT) family kinase protein
MSKDTKPIRNGEEIDAKNLSKYLQDKISGEISIAQFPSGNSNLTYCVKIGETEYVLRRPPFGNTVKSAHDMSREFNVLDKLSKVYLPAPKPILLCQDQSIIGSEFYLMERRNGLIIRGKLSEPLAVANGVTLSNSPELRMKVVESFIQNLVDLHKLDYEAAGLGDFGKPEGYAIRQVEGWSKRYFNAKTGENIELEKTIEWLNANIPNDETASLVHNDYKFDNIMLNPSDLTEIIAVLDWEMTTIGSPLMDFGTTLGYWMSKEVGEDLLNMPFNPRVLMENVSRQQLADLYAEKSGRDLHDILFYYVFGTFKIAVIAQQIYSRFARGFTKDKRFENFHIFVNALGKIAFLAIQTKRI